MTHSAFNNVFHHHELNYKLNGDIQINHSPFMVGDLTIGKNSIVIHDTAGTSKGSFILDDVIGARAKDDELSTIVILNNTSCTTINIILHL